MVEKSDYLEKKYQIIENGTSMIQEILRESIKANTEKIKRFNERDEQYRHKLFKENQKKFIRNVRTVVI